MKNVAWLVLIVLLGIQIVGQFLWMGQVEDQMQAMRSEVETLRSAVVQLGELIAEEDEPGMVIVKHQTQDSQ